MHGDCLVGKLVVFTMNFHLIASTSACVEFQYLNVESGDVGLIIGTKLAPRYMSDIIVDWYHVYVNRKIGWINNLAGVELLRDEL